MGTFLEIIEILKQFGILAGIGVILTFAGIAVLMPGEKQKLFYRIRHKRNKAYFAVGFICTGAIFVIWHFKWILPVIAVVILCFMAIYFAYGIYSLKHPSPYVAYALRKYKKLFAEGRPLKSIEFFEGEHWYIISRIDKIKFSVLKAKYLFNKGDHIGAYKEICKIDEALLYRSEKKEITDMKSNILWFMGDFSAAARLLSGKEYDDYWRKHMQQSFILENAGDLDGAFNELLEAKSLCCKEAIEPSDEITVLINFGRIQLLRGNRTECIQYTYQAKKLYEKLDLESAEILHTIMENLIVNEAIVRGDHPVVHELMREYRSMITFDSIDNFIQYTNVCIAVYRQINDLKRTYEHIKNGYFEVVDKLDITQRALLQASTFRMLINGHFVHDWLDPEIARDYERYEELDVAQKLLVYKEFYGVFTQPDYLCVRNSHPYALLNEQIKGYYFGPAVKDIDGMLYERDTREIGKRCTCMEQKLFVLKHTERELHIQNSKQIYRDLCEMQEDAGLHIRALNTQMLIMDECGSPDNILIQPTPYSDVILYQHYIDAIEDPPMPKPHKNGYQLYYYEFSPRPYNFYPKEKKTVEEQAELLMPEVRKLKNHPAKYDLAIHIAHFLMALERPAEAKEFYDMFCESKNSINHYSSWLRSEFYHLKEYFEQESEMQDNGI